MNDWMTQTSHALPWWQSVRNHSNMLHHKPVTDDNPTAAQLLHCSNQTPGRRTVVPRVCRDVLWRAVAPTLLSLSFTSSTPSMSPLPLTSPMRSCLDCSCRSRFSRWLPTCKHTCSSGGAHSAAAEGAGHSRNR